MSIHKPLGSTLRGEMHLVDRYSPEETMERVEIFLFLAFYVSNKTNAFILEWPVGQIYNHI